ncbi:MAG: EAL domain-containing protein [Acidimicrobiales bacterium]
MKSESFPGAEYPPSPAPWTIRTLRGGSLDGDTIASTSGLRISAVVGALCIVLSLTVVWRGDVTTTSAGFWPAAGLAVVAMLVVPVRRWGWVIAGIVSPTALAFALGMMPLVPAIWWAVANVVEPALGATILRRYGNSRDSRQDGMTAIFFLGAVVLAPVVGATIGTAGTLSAYDRSWSSTWLEWVVGDGLGVLVMVPLLMTYTSRRGTPRNGRERFALGTLMVSAVALSFANLGPTGSALVPYLVLVVLLWTGMRFGLRSAAGAGFIVSLAANIATSHGWGPFAAGDGEPHVISIQFFLAIALVTSFVVASTMSELADREEVNTLLTVQATHDGLTGLPNRVLFGDRLRQAFERRQSDGSGVGIVLIDLDDFKKINDRHGHPAGDGVLGVVARRMASCVGSDGLIARMGGDEFAVLCDRVESREPLTAIAAQVAQALELPVEIDGLEHHLSASVGVAWAVGDDTVSATELFRRSDVALYESKRRPELMAVLFDDELEIRTRRRTEIEVELRGAIARDELSVVYQPIVSLPAQNPVGCEALVRWTNRRLGTVGPDEFISIAERAGLIGLIGDWVLEVACRQLAEWRSGDSTDADQPGLYISVNVSPRQLSDQLFPARVRRILESVSLPPDALVLEITETAIIDDLDVSLHALAELRQLGVRLSMDDFGTGYSSLTYLRMLPVDSLKIDRSFVAEIGGASNNIAIVRTILSLAAELDLDVIAEGIETAEQAQTLSQLGCRLGQGYFFARPTPNPDLGRPERRDVGPARQRSTLG